MERGSRFSKGTFLGKVGASRHLLLANKAERTRGNLTDNLKTLMSEDSCWTLSTAVSNFNPVNYLLPSDFLQGG